MARITDEDFDNAIANALDSVPDEFLDDLENIVIMAQDEPEDYQLEQVADGTVAEDGDLLGLYDGVSLYDRSNSYGMPGDLPDIITIFKGPHERLGLCRADTLKEVRKTVIHELGHYFGMDEDDIARMGYE